MDLTEEIYGSLLFLRKNGQLGTTYPLYNGKISIGSSRDADIRFKFHDKRLEQIHCIIEVNEVGIATLLNKSISEPVKINTISIRKNRILRDNDEIELVGKKFLYVNGNTSKRKLDSHHKPSRDARSIISKRHSSTSLLNLKRAKKSPNFKTKTPIQRRPSTRKFCPSTSSDFTVTHKKEPVMDKCKTMPKVTVSKALGSPGSSRKRRLSFGDTPKKLAKSPWMSARNILLSENTVSSTITEQKKSVLPKLSVSNTKLKQPRILSGKWIQSVGTSDLSSDESVKLNLSSNSSISPLKSSPRKSSNYSSKKSLSRKSLRQSNLQEEKLPKSPRNSLLKQCLRKNQERSLTHSRESLQSNPEESINQFSNEVLLQLSESHTSNNSYRQSLRKSIKKERERHIEEFLSQESDEDNLNTSSSYSVNKSVSKLRLSLRQSKTMEKQCKVPGRLTTSKGMNCSANKPERESLVRKSNKLEREEEIEMSSSEESMFLNTSVNSPEDIYEQGLSTPSKETLTSRKPTKRRSSTRTSNKLNNNEEINLLGSQESVVLNISAMDSPKELSVQRISATTPKQITVARTPKERRSSVRRSNVEKDKELSSSEEFIQRWSTTTPKERVRNSKKKASSVRKNNEEIGEVSFSKESTFLNTFANSPENICEQGLLTTSKETVTFRKSTERRSSTRTSNKLNDNEEINLLCSQESLVSNISATNSPKQLSIQKTSPTTPKQITCVDRTPKERRSSVRRSNVEKDKELSSSEKFIQRWPTATPKERVRNSKKKASSVRKNNDEIGEVSFSEESMFLNTSVNSPENICEQGLSTTSKETVTSRKSTKRRSSTRTSNKLNDNEEINLLSSQESLVSNISATYSPKQLSVQKTSPTTPKQITTVDRTPKERRSSVRKSNVEKDKELSSSEEFIQRWSTATPKERVRNSKKKASSMRKNNEEIGEVFSSEESSVSDISAMNTPKETSQRRLTIPKEMKSSIRTSKERRSSMRKSNKLNQDGIGELLSNKEFLLQNSTINSPKEKSIHGLSTTPKEIKASVKLSRQRGSSVGRSTELIINEEIGQPSSSEDSLEFNVSAISSSKESLQNQSLPTKRSRSKSLNRDSIIPYTSNSKNSTPISPTCKKSIGNQIYDQSVYSSQNESELSVESPQGSNTPKIRHSSVRKNHLKTKEENEIELSLNKSPRSNASSTRRSYTNTTAKFDGLKSNPNISVITLNDSIEGTPENNMSIIIIDTPLEKTRKSHKLSKTLNSSLQDDVELTTPKSAIKSRRSKSLPYNPLTEEITPVSPLSKSKNESGFKTPLNTPGLFEDIKKSVLKSRSQMQKSSNNLMEELNKVEPKKKGIKRPRESRGSYVGSSKRRKIVEIQANERLDTSDETYSTSFESFTTEDILTDVSEQGITQITPKHFSDLTDKPVITHPQIRSFIEPIKKRSSSMRPNSQLGSTDDSVINDSNISEIDSSSEQNASTFEDVSDYSSRTSGRSKPRKSPKNDLRHIPNLRKLLYPQQQNSPKNDLSDVAGLKKLLSTPKEVKSPKNDLRNVPNLRRIMSPKQQNSPKNDLTDVRGLKKLLRTPKERRESQNDLRDVEGVANIFNISGVERLSVESDIENNENLFDKIFARKPLKTYRGKSLSPASRKTKIFDDKRKTLGDVPYASPRVEKWIEEQAFIKLKSSQDNIKINQTSDNGVELLKKPSRGRRKVNEDKQEFVKKQTIIVDEVQSNEISNTKNYSVDEVNSTSREAQLKVPTVKSGRSKKILQTNLTDEISRVHSTTEDIKISVPDQGIGRRVIEPDEYTEVVVPSPRRGGRRRNLAQVESLTRQKKEELPQPRRVRDKRKYPVKKDEESGNESDVKFVAKEEAKPTRGRGRKVVNNDEVTVKVVSDEEQKAEQADNTPIITKRTRGRKQNVVESDSSKSEIMEETSKAKINGKTGNKKGSRSNKNKVENVQPEVDTVKSTRGREKLTIKMDVYEDNNKEEEIGIAGVVKKTRRTKKKTDEINNAEGEKEMASSKLTRGRKRLAGEIAETVEEREADSEVSEVVKKVGRSKKKTKVEIKDVEDEVTFVRPTRGRKQAAKTIDETLVKTNVEMVKEKILDDSVPVDSPRTARAKRGNFNKYGSDFLTECDSGKDDSKKKKHVQFVETEEDSKNKKRKGKTVAATENVVRRSKRIHK